MSTACFVKVVKTHSVLSLKLSRVVQALMLHQFSVTSCMELRASVPQSDSGGKGSSTNNFPFF